MPLKNPDHLERLDLESKVFSISSSSSSLSNSGLDICVSLGSEFNRDRLAPITIKHKTIKNATTPIAISIAVDIDDIAGDCLVAIGDGGGGAVGIGTCDDEGDTRGTEVGEGAGMNVGFGPREGGEVGEDTRSLLGAGAGSLLGAWIGSEVDKVAGSMLRTGIGSEVGEGVNVGFETGYADGEGAVKDVGSLLDGWLVCDGLGVGVCVGTNTRLKDFEVIASPDSSQSTIRV